MTKAIIGIIVVIILAAGGYYVYTSMMGNAPASAGQQSTTTAQATTTPPLQVQAQELTVGTGTEAIPGSVVSVLYIGKLTDGTTFDSSAAHGNTPLTFALGTQGLIPGFQIGINGMKVGGERLLAIPPDFAYGTQDVKDPTSGKVVIPANSTLIFDIKLLKVAPASSTPSTKAPTPAH